MQIAAGQQCRRLYRAVGPIRSASNTLTVMVARTQIRTAAPRNIASRWLRTTSGSKITHPEEEPIQHEGHIVKELPDIDKQLRFKPLSAVDSDNENDLEGKPESSDDEGAYLESGDPDPRHKLGKALLSLGKIHYRHVDSLPEWFLERQNEICQYRTNPQIRRCLKDWMIKHDRDLLEKYRNKTLQWGHKLSTKAEPLDLKVYGPEETIAYANYYMPSRFGLLNRVFGELKKIAPEFAPRRTVDFGCGPATGAAAIHHTWGTLAERYTGIDISQSMIDAGRIMTRDKIRDAVFYTSNGEVVKRAANTGERFDLAVCSYTLSELPNDPSRRIAVQMLFELLDVGGYLVILEPGNPVGSHAVRTARQFVLDTFNHVDRSGRTPPGLRGSTFFQPGQEENSAVSVPDRKGPHARNGKHGGKQSAFEDVDSDFDSDSDISNGPLRGASKRARAEELAYQQVDMMLDPPRLGGLGYDQLAAHAVAPCTHDRPCPMMRGTWCSFSQKVYSGVIRKSSEEKYSYVILQKRPKGLALASFPTEAGDSSRGGSKGKGPSKSLPQSQQQQLFNFGKWVTPAPVSAPASAGPEGARHLPAATEAASDPTPLAVLERFVGAAPKQVPRLVDQLIDEVDWEDYNPPLHREEWGRLIRSPIKSKGHVVMDLCTPEGRLLRNTVSRSNLHHIPALYSALRKTTWGGLFPVFRGPTEHLAVARQQHKGAHLQGGAGRVGSGDRDRERGSGEDRQEGKKPHAQRKPQWQDSDSEGDEDGLRDSALNMFGRRGSSGSSGSSRISSSGRQQPPRGGTREGQGEGERLGGSAQRKSPMAPAGKAGKAGKAGEAAVSHAAVVADAGSARYRQLMAAKAKAPARAKGTAETEVGPQEEEKTGGRRGRQSGLSTQLARARLQRRQQTAAHDDE